MITLVSSCTFYCVCVCTLQDRTAHVQLIDFLDIHTSGTVPSRLVESLSDCLSTIEALKLYKYSFQE